MTDLKCPDCGVEVLPSRQYCDACTERILHGKKCAICGEPDPVGLMNSICDSCSCDDVAERQVTLGKRIQKLEALAKNAPLIGPSSVKR